nr:3-phosphoshikimate 1-carboxyvinyltransferase 2 [Tanacetum cinerariifolium]
LVKALQQGGATIEYKNHLGYPPILTKGGFKGNQEYKTPGHYTIEGDASSASYFLAASAIKGGSVKVLGIGQKSIQGDIKFADILEKMGA